MSQLWQLLSFVIPAAIGSAMNPTILASMTGILSEPKHPREKGFSFLVGGVLSLLVWIVIVYSAIWAYLQQVEADARAYINVIDIVLGAILLLASVYLAVFKPKALFARDPDEPPAGQAKPDQHLWRYVAVGFVMQGRDVSSIVLFIAALQHIAGSSVPWETKIVVLLGTVTITTTAMWLPLIAHVTIPRSFTTRAQPSIEWLRRNARTITIWVCTIFGVYLVIRGILEP